MEIILDDLGLPDSIHLKSLRMELGFLWGRKGSTCKTAPSVAAGEFEPAFLDKLTYGF